jgi:hypothetical protein
MFGSKLPSYVSTAFGDMRHAVKSSVPMEFELKRARTLIQKIDPEIKEARRDVARAEVELDNNKSEIRRLDATVAKARVKMQRHRQYLAGEGEAVPVFDSDSEYGTVAVQRELCRTFDMYKNQSSLLTSKKALQKRQQQILKASRTKLIAVRAERNKLMDMVATLDARKRQQDAMAANLQKFDLDTSALSQAKKTIADIKKRLDVSQKIIQEELFLTHGVTVTEPADEDKRDILGEMEDYFSGNDTRTSKVSTLNGK